LIKLDQWEQGQVVEDLDRVEVVPPGEEEGGGISAVGVVLE